MSDGLVDFVKFSATRAANGDLSSLVAIPPYREPYQIKSNSDEILLHCRDAANDTIWHRAWYQLSGGGQLSEIAVVDKNTRSGEYGPGNPQTSITTVGAVIVGSVMDSLTTPTVLRDGTFGNADSVRASVLYDDIKSLQQLTALEDDAYIFAIGSLYIQSGGGDVAGPGPGGLFKYLSGDSTPTDGLTVYDLVTLPGRLIRQPLDVQGQFMRDVLGIYADTAGEANLRLHALALNAVGAADAWMGWRAERGNDGKDYTDLDFEARDWQTAITAFMRMRSYGDSDDYIAALKPFLPAPVATTAAIPTGAEARVTADKRIWLNDADRGLVKRLYSDTEQFRAIVDDLAELAALTPDNWEDNERALSLGRDAAGDTKAFWYYWLSGSSSPANGRDIIIPDQHIDTSPWTEPGRFILGSALTAATLDTGGSGAYVADAFKRDVIILNGGGSLDDVIMAENDQCLVLRGDADVNILHDAAKISLPNDTTLPLTNANKSVTLYSRNGVKFVSGGGGSGSFVDGGALTIDGNSEITVEPGKIYTLPTSGTIAGVIGLTDGQSAQVIAGASGSVTLTDEGAVTAGVAFKLSGTDLVILAADETIYTLQRKGSEIRLSGGSGSVGFATDTEVETADSAATEKAIAASQVPKIFIQSGKFQFRFDAGQTPTERTTALQQAHTDAIAKGCHTLVLDANERYELNGGFLCQENGGYIQEVDFNGSILSWEQDTSGIGVRFYVWGDSDANATEVALSVNALKTQHVVEVATSTFEAAFTAAELEDMRIGAKTFVFEIKSDATRNTLLTETGTHQSQWIEVHRKQLKSGDATKTELLLKYPLRYDFLTADNAKIRINKIHPEITLNRPHLIGSGARGYFGGQYRGQQGTSLDYGTETITSVDAGTDTFTATGHSLTNDDRVWYISDDAPAGLTGALNISDARIIGNYVTPYYVINSTANTFQLSATLGGAAVNITDAGSGTQMVASALDTSLDVGLSSQWLDKINVIDPIIRNMGRQATFIQHCREAYVEKPTVDCNFPVPYNGFITYGITYGGTIDKFHLRGGRVNAPRHCVVHSNSIGGRTQASIIEDVLCEGSTEAAISEHSGLEAADYLNCKIQNAWDGFNLRGPNRNIVGGWVKRVFSTNGGEAIQLTQDVSNIIVDGLLIEDARFGVRYKHNAGQSFEPDNFVFKNMIVRRCTNYFDLDIDYITSGETTYSQIGFGRIKFENIFLDVDPPNDQSGATLNHEIAPVSNPGDATTAVANFLHVVGAKLVIVEGYEVRVGGSVTSSGTPAHYAGHFEQCRDVLINGVVNDGAEAFHWDDVTLQETAATTACAPRFLKYDNLSYLNFPNATLVYVSEAVGDSKVFPLHGRGNNFIDRTNQSISGDAVTLTNEFHIIDTESDASSDNLNNITLADQGQVTVIRSENNSRDFNINKTAGQINFAAGGLDALTFVQHSNTQDQSVIRGVPGSTTEVSLVEFTNNG